MKSYIALENRLTKGQKRLVEAAAAESELRKREDAMRRWYKILAIALNRSHGFGGRRIAELIQEIEELCVLSETDEVFWTHVDGRLQQMGLDIEPEKED